MHLQERQNIGFELLKNKSTNLNEFPYFYQLNLIKFVHEAISDNILNYFDLYNQHPTFLLTPEFKSLVKTKLDA